MKREEIIKIFEENHIAEGNATINATKLAEIFTKHETDLLKEFVEWLKHKQHISVENYKKLFEQTKNYLYCGKRDEAEYTLETLESDLEKFLEERKNG